MQSDGPRKEWIAGLVPVLVGTALAWLAQSSLKNARADGFVVAPKDYHGSLEERAQEAIILFHAGDRTRPAAEDLILKIKVEGSADSFAWVIALPGVPTIAPEDSKLFEELHRYVQMRQVRHSKAMGDGVKSAMTTTTEEASPAVEVLSRKDVGSYDVAIVREKREGSLNRWLSDNGFRALENGDDLIKFYREKGYVFACARVNRAALAKGVAADLHPLRFSFSTGGQDGIYFPMRLTGLQSAPFDVNLYVLYGKWLNDRINGFGFSHRGFRLNWRDFDSPDCEPNAGKRWSDPSSDPYLRPYVGLLPTVTTLCQKLHPGERYYLTNLNASGLLPRDVRDWPDDLWLFPYYTDPDLIPQDALPGKPASAAYRHIASDEVRPRASATRRSVAAYRSRLLVTIVLGTVALGCAVIWLARARKTRLTSTKGDGTTDF